MFANVGRTPTSAIPLFAQRYHLRCDVCHSVLPELNAFGNAFRDRGYRIAGLPIHGTTGLAVRYQLGYDRDPANGAPRFVPAGVLLSQANAGAISAFVHYNLGSQGGPSALYLAFLSTYNAHTQALYRLGLYELPLLHSPAQRNDTLLSYGYEGTRAGLDNLLLAQPRLGLEAERRIGVTNIDASFAIGEYLGAAYGGRPIATGEASGPAQPELGLFARAPVGSGLLAGLDLIEGKRAITAGGRPTFDDSYNRTGAAIEATRGGFDLLAEQWWGHDANADGFGNAIFSSGGYVRFRFHPTPHAALGVRYDAAANPTLVRDYVLYAEALVTPHARLLLEEYHPLGGGKPDLMGALTIGFPWPPGY